MRTGARTVRPYSDPVQDLSEYACVKHHFKMLEASGSSVRCAKTGIEWHPFEMDIDPVTKSIWFNKHYDTYTTDGLVTGGDWQPLLEPEYILQMYAVKVKDMQEFTTQDLTATPDNRMRVRCRIGPLDDAHKLDPSFNGHKFGCSLRTNLHVAVGGDAGTGGWFVVPEVKLDISYFDQTIFVVSKLWRNGLNIEKEITVYDSVGTLLLTAARTEETPLPGNIHAPRQAGLTGGYFYGAAWFGFQTGYPADLATAIKWMAASWVKGDRLIYPGWRFKT